MRPIGGATAQPIRCGDTLGPGGVFTLQADVVCEGLEVGLTVRDGAKLHLGGHTVVAFIGVLMTGQGATLQNGRVSASEAAVQVDGEGGHTVRDVETDSSGEPASILIVSDGNRIERSVGSSAGAGFVVLGADNRLQQNTGIGQVGFVVVGDGNTLRQNFASRLRSGLVITGDGNTLRENEVRRNGDEGIRVSGAANTITHNTVLGNRVDLIDVHADCDENRWTRNIFATSQAGDTANPACIQ
jgi:parallel beta-helix repeat protein